jgi:SAM-dependent methyltransferase
MDFNDYSSSYDEMLAKQHSFFSQDRSFFHESKIAHLRSFVDRDVQSVLDLGCGVGGALPCLRSAFPNAAVFGFDPSSDSVSIAQQRHPWAFLVDREHLADRQYDVVYMACVMHHIPPSEWRRTIREATDLLMPGGILAVFEHNPWNPVTQRLVRQCPFDADAVLLRRSELLSLFRSAGLAIKGSGYYLVFPQFLRGLIPLERFIRWLPVGGQYYVAGGRQSSP